MLSSVLARRRPQQVPAPIACSAERRIRTAVVLPAGCFFSASEPNSMETVVRTLAAAMPQQQVRIFCCQGASDHGDFDVSVVPTGPRRRADLLKAVRAFSPDIVEHHQQVKQAMFLSRALPGTPHVLYRHNALKPPRTPLDSWRYNARYRTLDGFIFVSAASRSEFVRNYPRLAERAWAVPNPIEAAPWIAPPDKREPVIAFAGRAMPEKGLAEVCAALPPLLDRHLEWRAVLMLGDWSLHRRWAEPHLKALLPYGARVDVLRSAPLAEVQRRMKTAAIALTPSTWDEPFGLTAVEAHAAGAALVSSGRGGLREASGPHAAYLEEVTPQALITAIDDLIRDSGRRVALAQAAQRRVLEVHAPERRAAELLHVRQAILARRTGRRS